MKPALWLVIVFAMGPLFWAMRAESTAAAASEETEEIEEIQEVAEAPAGEASSPLKRVGRLHPPLVHFPVAWIILSLILEMLSRLRLPVVSAYSEKLDGAVLIVLFLAAGSALAALVTGTILHEEIEASAGDQTLLHLHQRLAWFTTAFTFLAFAAKAMAWKTGKKVWGWAAAALIFAAAAQVTITGHMGGSMVFGTGYLLGK